MKRKLMAITLVLALFTVGCAGQVENGGGTQVSDNTDTNNTEKSGENNNTQEDSTQSTAAVTEVEAVDTTDMFTDRDMNSAYDESNSAYIEMNGASATCSSSAVTIEGSTITISDEGTYILTGTLDDGMIIVNADDSDKLQLVLNGVNITSSTSAPIYILEADKVVVTLHQDTENQLANGGEYVAIDDNNIDSVIYSKQDLSFNGEGKLEINAQAGHGIVCKDDLVFTNGSYTINSASHGVDANDSVRVVNASFAINAGKDGIHVENTEDTTLGFAYIESGIFDISAQGDGISTSAYAQIEDGEFNIVAGGGSENAQKQTSESWGGFGGGARPGGRGGFQKKPQGEMPQGEMPQGEMPQGEMPQGEMPQGEMPQGEIPQGEPPQGEAPQGEMPQGEAPQGEMPQGEVPQGEVSQAEVSQSTTSEKSDDSSTSIKGIKCAGNLVINGGNYKFNTADDAIHTNASLAINGGEYEIQAGDDGVHADETVIVSGGNINITESYEGIEGLHVNIKDGNIALTASDDGINAAGGTDSSGFGGPRGKDSFGGSASSGSITIAGGNLNIQASGDGIDANGSLEITGGYTIVSGPTQGDTATLDYDVSGIITGGTFIGTGASGMALTFSDSQQGVITIDVGNQEAGTEVTLTDANGNTIVSHTPQLSYSTVILSSPDIASGAEYTLKFGNESAKVSTNN